MLLIEPYFNGQLCGCSISAAHLGNSKPFSKSEILMTFAIQKPLSCFPELSEPFHGFPAMKQARRPHSACPPARLNGDKETAAVHVMYSPLVCRGPELTAE